MDVHFTHPTAIHVLSVYTDDDPASTADLVAIAGAHSVQVVLLTSTEANLVANFHVGTRLTALAWSSATVSPDSSDEWQIE
jgi:hypothetical protein